MIELKNRPRVLLSKTCVLQKLGAGRNFILVASGDVMRSRIYGNQSFSDPVDELIYLRNCKLSENWSNCVRSVVVFWCFSRAAHLAVLGRGISTI